MRAPSLVYAALAAEMLPVLAVQWRFGRRAPAPLQRLQLAMAVSTFDDLLLRAWALLFGVNHWLVWFMVPVEAMLALRVTESLAPDARIRAWCRWAIAIIGVLGIAVIATLGVPSRFDGRYDALVALAVFTLILSALASRVLRTRDVAIRQDWFWILSGMAVQWFGSSTIDGFAFGYATQHPEWAPLVFTGRAVLMLVAFTLMAWGVMCSRVRAASPGHS